MMYLVHVYIIYNVNYLIKTIIALQNQELAIMIYRNSLFYDALIGLIR